MYFQNYALIQLQYAQYAEESHELGDKSLMTAFRAVTAACPKWEEGHYALAMYCTTLAKETEQSLVFRIETQTNCNLVTSDSVLELKQRTILEFAESLKCGFAFHAVSVPLMINTWIELG